MPSSSSTQSPEFCSPVHDGLTRVSMASLKVTCPSHSLVSVIIPNLNRKRLLERCLLALFAQSYPHIEIIVVDNGSTDGSVAWLKQQRAQGLVLIANKSNLGFSTACNLGIQASKGDFIALLNNDAYPSPDWIDELVRTAKADAAIGMCASKIYFSNQPRVIENVGHLLYPDGLNRGRGRLEIDEGQYDQDPDALLPSGAAGFYRRAMLNEVGFLDEDFFAYGEDTDLGLRGRAAGWLCRFVPTAVVYHEYSGTSGEYSLFKAFHVERNRVWVAIKHLPLPMLLISPFYTFFRFVLQAYGALTGKGAAGHCAQQFSKWDLLVTLVKAYTAAIAGIPRMWRKRKTIHQFPRWSSQKQIRLFRQFRLSAYELALKD